MKQFGKSILILALMTLCQLIHAQAPESTPEEAQYLAQADELWSEIDRQRGSVELPGGIAVVTVPNSFYYLNPDDAEKVLVEMWGNPPGSGLETLGMLFPSDTTPFDHDSWGVVIEYEEDGYVSDADAGEIDYQAMLEQMQQQTAAASKERVQAGYDAMELVGWAAKPFYDQQTHKLHWAKEIKFGDQEVNTLNYNIRVLGRKGVLVLNFVANMDQQQLIDSQIGTVLALAEFNSGYRYQDFDPNVDKMAAYGIGALIAGKVAAKTGLLAALFLFLKKFGVIVVAALVTIGGKLVKRGKS